MSDFVTPPRSTKPKKHQSISPSRKSTAAIELIKDDKKSVSISTNTERPTESEKLLKINKPSKNNPFATRAKEISKINKPSRNNPFSTRPKQSEEPDMIRRSSSFRSSKGIKITPTMSDETEEAADALRNIIDNSRNPDYDAESDPNYQLFHEWVNDKRSTSDIESGLTVRKTNGTLPTEDELKYIADIQPYLLAYKIHCKKFSTTFEQFEKCYPIYLKIKQLIDEYRDNDIRFFRGDLPNKELIYMVHFPRKKTTKARSLEKKSRSTRKQSTHSRGGKNSKTSKKRY